MPPVKTHIDQNGLIPTKNFKYADWPFEEFNPVQSRAYELYDKDINCLVAAATSAGKTVVAEMFLSHEMRVRGGKGMFLTPFNSDCSACRGVVYSPGERRVVSSMFSS